MTEQTPTSSTAALNLRERSLKAFELPCVLLEIEEKLWELHETEGPDAPVPAELQAAIDKFCAEGPVALEKVHRAIVAIRREGETCKEMASALSARASTKEASAKRLEGMLLQVIDTAFNGKVKLGSLTIYGQNNTSESVDFESADPYEQAQVLEKLPAEYRRVKVELDKTKAKAAIKAGNSIPGLMLRTSSSRSIRFRV